MFRPRMDQKYFYKPICYLDITIDPPSIRAITTPNAGILPHRPYELRFLFCNDGIFDRDQHRAIKKFIANLFDDDRGAPMIPRTEISRGIREPSPQGNDRAPDSPNPRIN